MNLGNSAQDRKRFGDRRGQKVGARHSFILNGKRFTVVTFSAAHFAIHVYVRKKAHLDFAQAITLTRFATSTLHIKTKAPRFVSARSRFRQHCVKLTNWGENPCVRSRIRSRRSADRRLVEIGRASCRERVESRGGAVS